MPSHWRTRSRAIIREVIRKAGTRDRKALWVPLRDAYPFGERRMWPYQVWLDEIKVQLGEKPPRGDGMQTRRANERAKWIKAGQGRLF